MSAIATIIAWVLAGLGVGRRRQAAAEPQALGEGDVAQSDDVEDSAGGPAYLLDHGDRRTRAPSGARSSGIEVSEQRERAGPRPLGPPRVDGGTEWVWSAPKGVREWVCWRSLQDAARRGESVVEIVTEDGEVIDYGLERGAPASGTLVLHTGDVRLEVARTRAKIRLSQLAAEVEGVESWAARELPRAGWTLLGLGDGEDLRAAGLETGRIDLALDVGGLALVNGDELLLVSRATTWAKRRRPEILDGYGAGTEATPSSVRIYGKRDQLSVLRGPEHAALLGRLRDAGLGDDEGVGRVELSTQGRALTLRAADGRELDLRDPWAPCSSELLAALWVDGTARHRVADPRPAYWERLGAWQEAGGQELGTEPPRLRDEPVAAWWLLVQGAAGEGAGLCTRVAAERQLAASTAWAIDRLADAGAGVEVLLDGEGDGARAREALASATRAGEWARRVSRARARYAALVRRAKDGEP